VKQIFASFLVVMAFGCGPSVRGDDTGDDDDTAGPDAGECVPTEATETDCDNGIDDDCDGTWNCADPDCSGVDGCPVCGEAQHLEGEPLALPDVSNGTCTNPYVSTINITGLPDGAVLTDLGDFLGVCVTMEHSWLRDLQLELSTPDGTVIVLQQFLGASCPGTGACEIWMGVPDDSDGTDPVPGTGYDYCWTPTATTAPMLDYAAAQAATHLDLPAGDYQSVSGFDGLVGTPLNGAWTIKVVDCWGIDNGFIFDWTIKFNSDLVEDCSDPIG
jgi:subtilisin-like proprotein convertase family protein